MPNKLPRGGDRRSVLTQNQLWLTPIQQEINQLEKYIIDREWDELYTSSLMYDRLDQLKKDLQNGVLFIPKF